MLDFVAFGIRKRKGDKESLEAYPKFIIKKTEDLMIRGGDFYAIWLEDRSFWSTDEQDAIDLIDHQLEAFVKEYVDKSGRMVYPAYMRDSETGVIDQWHKYCQRQMRDRFHMLDETIIFSDMDVKKTDYASKKLSYPLKEGPCDSWERLISTLYSPEERHKIEWAIGSIVSGDSRVNQKFMVLYGAMGTGKSTILNVIEQLFEGYCDVFDAKALGSSNNSFSLEAFKNNPLVAIQHDGDLSRIEDNTKLNSLVSHESITVNEKFKSTYSNKFKTFLFIGSNNPVRITDAKSGLMRRLIDVTPTGNKVPTKEYNKLVKSIKFELGAIAKHCLDVYTQDPDYYNDYQPINMLGATNDFYNFIEDSFPLFKKSGDTTLANAWQMYKDYCEEAKVGYPMPKRAFKEELKNYFSDYKEQAVLSDGTHVRSFYIGFKEDKFASYFTKKPEEEIQENISRWIELKEQLSVLDVMCAKDKAQYATENGTPFKPWDKVKTTLEALDTSKLHYIFFTNENHIVIDFDYDDLDKNLEEANKFPRTYCEVSRSGKGLHLHYIYDGDVNELSRIYSEKIEIKVFTGKSALRRKLTLCNSEQINTINSGLPLKGEKKVVNFEALKSEKAIRTMIKRNLNKEYHAYTTPSVMFIHKILEDAYNAGTKYDVSDMRNAIFAFAASSTNQAGLCMSLVNKMKFKSEEPSEPVDEPKAPIVFYDVEVFPNLFIVCWKYQGKEAPVIKLINPDPERIKELMRFRLIGFNNRRYDNHILYARAQGYSISDIYRLSQKIIATGQRAMIGEAYNVSYTDIYDFCSKKQSLKKWEIELGIHHQELGFRWDEPVPEDKWEMVADYCCNDVIATEAVFDARQGDWAARQILAELAHGSVNDTTNSLTTKIIFGGNRHPGLVYTDLATGRQYGPGEAFSYA